MTERSLARPGLEFQTKLRRDLLDEPQEGKIFSWRDHNVYGEPIDMDVKVLEAGEKHSLYVTGAIRLNNRTSGLYLYSSDVPNVDGDYNKFYIGEEHNLIRWLDTIAKELRGGMHQHAIVDCISVVLLKADSTPDKGDLYDSLLKELSENRARSMIEDLAKLEQIYKFDDSEVAQLFFMLGTSENERFDLAVEQNPEGFAALEQRMESIQTSGVTPEEERNTRDGLRQKLVAFMKTPDEVLEDNGINREVLFLLKVLQGMSEESTEKLISHL